MRLLTTRHRFLAMYFICLQRPDVPLTVLGILPPTINSSTSRRTIFLHSILCRLDQPLAFANLGYIHTYVAPPHLADRSALIVLSTLSTCYQLNRTAPYSKLGASTDTLFSGRVQAQPPHQSPCAFAAALLADTIPFRLASTPVTDNSTLTWFIFRSLALRIRTTARPHTKLHTRDRDVYYVLLPSEQVARLIYTLSARTAQGNVFLTIVHSSYVHGFAHPLSTLCRNTMAYLSHELKFS